MRAGTPSTVALEAGATYRQRVRNPWPGRTVVAVDGVSGRVVLRPTTAEEFVLPVTAGRSYLLKPADQRPARFGAVTGRAPGSARHLGPVTIGLDPAPRTRHDSLAAAFDNVATTADTNTKPGNFDGAGLSFSASALAATGAEPGAAIEAGGMTFTWPDVAPGTPDNVVAAGQDITVGATGSTLGLLVSGSYGPAGGVGRITYTDGTSELYRLSTPDWAGAATSTAAEAVVTTVQNQPNNAQTTKAAKVFVLTVQLRADKTVDRVTLPDTGGPVKWLPSMHVFAMAVRN
jgi:hypothetical protein